MVKNLPPRTENNLLSSWDTFVEPLHAHPIFKKMGGLSLISAVLTRKVWLKTHPAMPALFPNLYVLLCGPPGSGKDLVVNTIRDLLEVMLSEMEAGTGINVGPESLSTKGLIDALADDNARFTFTYKEKGKSVTVHYHSLYIAIGELGAFMPEYNVQMVSIVNDLFGCKRSFIERVRGRGASSEVKIENPHLSLLLGTQPAVFARIFPEEAFSMGLTARLLICFANEAVRKPFFSDNNSESDSNLFNKIASDLRVISLMAGEYKPDKHFKEKLDDFHVNNPGAISHSRFTDYNVRRSLHLGKLAMCCAAAESNELILRENHFDRALEYLTLSEKDAPNLFDNLVTSNGFQHTVEQILHNKPQATITHAELERKLRKTHKPTEVGQIIRSMTQAEDITFTHYVSGLPVYKVNTKEILK
ncbi:MAG: DUF3987 domain-containing protein [Candidatus Competibacteraceae bacterium]|nr:DUF3987 domain-containing protein [Candidatus Competibacteraceae bacterium]